MNSHRIAFGSEESTPVFFAKYAFLASESALAQFISAWQDGTLPKSSWTHAAHLAVAAYFAFDHAERETFAIMRVGIRHYNDAVGTPNTDDSGYHETLTGFWCRQIHKLNSTEPVDSRLNAARLAVARFGEERGLFRHFYSFDVAKDRRARREWIAPDLVP